MKILSLLLIFCFSTTIAKEDNEKHPKYVKLKSSEINCRVGPGEEYPRSWILRRVNLPVKFIAEFYQWRKIKLFDNTEGWVHQNMITPNNDSALVKCDTFLYLDPSQKSKILAKIEKDVIIKVFPQKIKNNFVFAKTQNFKGWINKNCLLGIDI